MIKGLISVIIPIYNGEKWLRKAVNSVLFQTYTNVEILLIDDGSTDGSFCLCEEFAKDKRVHIYRKSNGGQSSARNLGLDMAQGEYVQFLDCDDTLEKEALTIALRSMKADTDIVLYGFNIYSNGKLLRKPYCNRISYHGEFNTFKTISRLLDSPCNKLYKRKYIKKKFREGLVYGEDGIFNYDNFTKDTKVECIEDCLYNVFLDNGSSVNRRYKKGRLYDTVVSIKTKLEKCISIFGADRNIFEYIPNSVNTLAYTIVLCASLSTYKDFSDELDLIQAEGYSDIFKFLYRNCNIGFLYKFILFAAVHKEYKPLLYAIGYCYKKRF